MSSVDQSKLHNYIITGCIMYYNFIYEQTKILYGIPKKFRCNKFQLFDLMQLEGRNDKKYTLQIRMVNMRPYSTTQDFHTYLCC